MLLISATPALGALVWILRKWLPTLLRHPTVKRGIWEPDGAQVQCLALLLWVSSCLGAIHSVTLHTVWTLVSVLLLLVLLDCSGVACAVSCTSLSLFWLDSLSPAEQLSSCVHVWLSVIQPAIAAWLKRM